MIIYQLEKSIFLLLKQPENKLFQTSNTVTLTTVIGNTFDM
jgi:hypothetical protein